MKEMDKVKPSVPTTLLAFSSIQKPVWPASWLALFLAVPIAVLHS